MTTVCKARSVLSNRRVVIKAHQPVMISSHMKYKNPRTQSRLLASQLIVTELNLDAMWKMQ